MDRFKLFPSDRNSTDDFILAVFGVTVGGIGDKVFRKLDAFAGNSTELFGFSLIIFTKIVNLVNKLLEDSAVWFVRGRVIISEKQDLVLEG